MKTFKCCYGNTNQNWVKIEAPTAIEAYQKYISQVGLDDYDVWVTTLLSGIQIFNQHRENFRDEQRRIEEERQRVQSINRAKEANKALLGLANEGYFKLDTEEKIKSQEYFEEVVKFSAERKLYDEEIEYLKLWWNFKDRQFGQSLLAQSEAGKPKEERGTKKLLQTISTGIIAGNFAKRMQLGELKKLNESVDEMNESVDEMNETGEDPSGGFEG